jgi:hypothetical protein
MCPAVPSLSNCNPEVVRMRAPLAKIAAGDTHMSSSNFDFGN